MHEGPPPPELPPESSVPTETPVIEEVSLAIVPRESEAVTEQASVVAEATPVSEESGPVTPETLPDAASAGEKEGQSVIEIRIPAIDQNASWHEVLGVAPNATHQEVQAAYRKLVREYHPDKLNNSPQRGAAEEFLKQVNNAVDEYKNPEFRARSENIRQQKREAEMRSRQPKGSGSHAGGSNGSDSSTSSRTSDNSRGWKAAGERESGFRQGSSETGRQQARQEQRRRNQEGYARAQQEAQQEIEGNYSYLFYAMRSYGIPFKDIGETPEELRQAAIKDREVLRTLYKRGRLVQLSPTATFFETLNKLYGEEIVLEEPQKLYKNEADIPSSVKGEHLENPFEQRTKVRLYDSTDPEQYLRFSLGGGAGEIFADPTTTLVNYYDSPENIEKEGMLGGYPAYVISRADETPKRSNSYRNCSTVIVVGEDMEGNQLSFLTHQNPDYFLTTHKEQFRTDVSSRIQEMVSRCKPGTIDVSVLGGNYYDSVNTNHQAPEKLTLAEQYQASIDELEAIIKEEFARYGQAETPIVALAGPDFSQHPSSFHDTDIVLDTQARIVLVSRPQQFYELANEVYDVEDRKEYQVQLNEAKGLFPKKRQIYVHERVNDDIASRKERGESMTPNHERWIHEDLKDAGVQTFESFERTDIHGFNAGHPFLEKGMQLLYGKTAAELQEEKLADIPNFEIFVGKMIDDVRKMAQSKHKILGGENSLLYLRDPESGEIEYLVGGLGGYAYIEEAYREAQEDIWMNNMSVLTKSLQRFIDMYVAPDARNYYSAHLHSLLTQELVKNVPAAQYESITGHL
jgi:curved DNA-binding protein CbpA